MLNSEKVVLMSQLAISEKEDGRDLKLYKYYKADYIRVNLIKTVLNVTVAYLLIVLMIALYRVEELIQKFADLDFADVFNTVLKGYIAVIIVYVVVGFVIYSRKYNKSKKKIVDYYRKLRLLSKFYSDEDEEE